MTTNFSNLALAYKLCTRHAHVGKKTVPVFKIIRAIARSVPVAYSLIALALTLTQAEAQEGPSGGAGFTPSIMHGYPSPGQDTNPFNSSKLDKPNLVQSPQFSGSADWSVPEIRSEFQQSLNTFARKLAPELTTDKDVFDMSRSPLLQGLSGGNLDTLSTILNSSADEAGLLAAEVFLKKAPDFFTVDTSGVSSKPSADGVLIDYYQYLPRLLGRPNMTVDEVNAELLKYLPHSPGTPISNFDGIGSSSRNYPFMVIGDNDLLPARDITKELSARDFFNLPQDCANAADLNGQQHSAFCPTPEQVDKIKMIDQATCLITHAGSLKKDDTGDQIRLNLNIKPGQACNGNSPVHCSGFLDPDRKHIWTAAHCLQGQDLPPLIQSELPAVGETVPCETNSAFRAVFGLRSRQSDTDPVNVNAIFGCSEITRSSEDVVRILLDTPQDRGVPAAIVPWTVPTVAFGNGNISLPAPPTYAVGYSFARTTELALQRKGEIRSIDQCDETILKASGRQFFLPEGKMAKDYYACISLDTLIGSSGGPVYAVTEDDNLIGVAVITRAYSVDLAVECAEPASEDGMRLNLAAWLQPLGN